MRSGQGLRAFVAGFAAYAIALQTVLAGVTVISRVASAAAVQATIICSSHLPGAAPDRPLDQNDLCACGPACAMAGYGLSPGPASPATALPHAAKSAVLLTRQAFDARRQDAA